MGIVDGATMDITEREFIVAYPTSNCRLVIEIGWWSIVLVEIKYYYATSAMTIQLENEAYLVLEYPLYNFIKNMFPFPLLKCCAK